MSIESTANWIKTITLFEIFDYSRTTLSNLEPLQNIVQAQAVMLTRRQTTEVNGKQEKVDDIMLKKYEIDVEATKSLHQAPAQ